MTIPGLGMTFPWLEMTVAGPGLLPGLKLTIPGLEMTIQGLKMAMPRLTVPVQGSKTDHSGAPCTHSMVQNDR